MDIGLTRCDVDGPESLGRLPGWLELAHRLVS
jgi:hypothetical protein